MVPRIVSLPSKHSTPRNGAPILGIVVHSTVGSDSRNYLVQNVRAVSIHALIQKDGVIYRMVPDNIGANHVGFSRITCNGKTYPGSGGFGPNQVTLGIELENWNDGVDPYPDIQLRACAWQINEWRKVFGNLPIWFHREIDTQGKTDARGLDHATLQRYLDELTGAPTAVASVTAFSPIMAAPRATVNQAISFIRKRGSVYDDVSIKSIVNSYWRYAVQGGVDPLVAIAQCIHETSDSGKPFSSWWAQRPRRNPAGLGVTGEIITGARPAAPEWAQKDSAGKVWAKGLSFASWDLSVQAHIGHLLVYAVGDQHNVDQDELIANDPRGRYVPAANRGTCHVLNDLNGKWAVPGNGYGAKIAEIATAILGEA